MAEFADGSAATHPTDADYVQVNILSVHMSYKNHLLAIFNIIML